MVSALDGDKAAYRTLLDDLSRRLKPYFLRRLFGDKTLAEDLMQETLLAIHTRRITYDRNMAFLPWVNAIARHKLVDHLRRHGRETTEPLEDDVPVADEAEAADARMDVHRMLDGLPERTAGLIRKVKIEGRSISEVAGDSGMSQSAVKVAIHRGLAMIMQRFGGKKHDR
jgi:RNA polymerase sigma-70 factor, ECF subfamily